MTPVTTVRAAEGGGAIPRNGAQPTNKRVRANLEAGHHPTSLCSHLQASSSWLYGCNSRRNVQEASQYYQVFVRARETMASASLKYKAFYVICR